jgi:hypothetical protein
MCRRKNCTPGDHVSVCPAHHRSPWGTMGQEHPGQPNPLLTWMMRGHLCAAPWVSRSRPAATEPVLEPGSLVAQLQCRTLLAQLTLLRCRLSDTAAMQGRGGTAAMQGLRRTVVMHGLSRTAMTDHRATREALNAHQSCVTHFLCLLK